MYRYNIYNNFIKLVVVIITYKINCIDYNLTNLCSCFLGEIIHSVSFNDALSNGLEGKRVLIVGIGNSAVDAAVNCATAGRCVLHVDCFKYWFC